MTRELRSPVDSTARVMLGIVCTDSLNLLMLDIKRYNKSKIINNCSKNYKSVNTQTTLKKHNSIKTENNTEIHPSTK